MTPKRRTEKKSGKQPRSGADPAMSIGIDLGTTRTVVSWPTGAIIPSPGSPTCSGTITTSCPPYRR